jgi:hypothetical protein
LTFRSLRPTTIPEYLACAARRTRPRHLHPPRHVGRRAFEDPAGQVQQRELDGGPRGVDQPAVDQLRQLVDLLQRLGE